MCVDDDPREAGIYLGTRCGSVYTSTDRGDTWTETVKYLLDVVVVRVATV